MPPAAPSAVTILAPSARLALLSFAIYLLGCPCWNERRFSMRRVAPPSYHTELTTNLTTNSVKTGDET